ncbi:MAG TPA: 16S rRNA (cytosine(967)-C(5))-methyltransferase RsmB [Acidiferrobacterales bacterium]|nr:16S rRNA (cytosine(967)-C(5))-methyltransferase RsmB [Acidiferrobacterales bacterium]
MKPENRSCISGTSAVPGGRTPAAARAASARAVAAVHQGRSLDAALAEVFSALPPALATERALIQEMAYGALRWHFQLLPLLTSFLDKPIKESDADLKALLMVGFYQLLHMRVAPHAAVKETVEAAAVLNKDWAKGMTNALLRRLLREAEQVRARIGADENLALAHPAWLLARIKTAWPDDWRAIAAANNARAPLTLRVHLGKITRAAYLARLAAAGISAHAVPEVDSALTLESPVAVESLPGFASGEVSVQDAAAQLAGALLDVRPGERVLDACAAPGGKAAHLLERTPQAALLALDVDAQRLVRVRENFARLGLAGGIAQGDAARPADWWDGRPFDHILLDAPCSATGVIRHHPDIRLHRTPADIERVVASQAHLLNALWPLLASGGKLLYVTCSILPEENALQMAAFLARQPDAQAWIPALAALERHARPAGTGFQILPGCADMDGFYYAGVKKVPAVA